MNEGSIARRYAKALLEIAQTQGKVDAFYNEISTLEVALKKSTDLKTVFLDPAFEPSVRKQILEKIVPQFSLSKEVLHFFKLLIDRERIRLLPEILLSYQDQADEVQARVRVEISSPYDLSSAEETRLKETLQKILLKQIILQKKKDASLLGGVLIRVKDVVFDGSLKNSLEKLKHQMMEAPIH
ncbi:MAG: ATP synthase F1 subunit delta [Deltaproteobacteria bacterium]|nr:ATP synthase F1 subunit delta [Deltaproteobacteria bacterium]